jgi:uroporphyrinogen-III synthase
VRTAEVYERRGLRGAARRVAEFAADPGAMLLASSAEAFALLLARLPAASTARGEALRRRPVVVSSARLAAIAHDAGFRRVLQARGPTPGALVEAASTAAPYTSPAASGRAPL